MYFKCLFQSNSVRHKHLISYIRVYSELNRPGSGSCQHLGDVTNITTMLLTAITKYSYNKYLFLYTVTCMSQEMTTRQLAHLYYRANSKTEIFTIFTFTKQEKPACECHNPQIVLKTARIQTKK